MKTVEDNLASGFEKLEKIDVLDSVLADCESGGAFIMAEKTKRRPIIKYLVGMAAALAIVVCAALAIGNRGLTANPISTDGDINARICLDVNPSVEIAVDKTETVVDVTADNEDGEKIINGMDFKGNGLGETVETLVNRMVDENYITNLKNSVLVSVASQNGEFGKELEKKMSDSIYELLGAKNIEGAVLSQTITQADDELMALAKMYNISFGKALMIKDIIDAGSFHNFESLASLSVNDLCQIRETVGAQSGRILVNGKIKSHYITVEKAVEVALNGASRSDVTDVRVMLEDWQGGEAAVRYHVTYITADGELQSYCINPINGKIIAQDNSGIASEYPVVSAEDAKDLAVKYICDLDGVSAEDIEVADCIITYDDNGYPRQYVTMSSLKDIRISYYAYVYDESVPSGVSGSIYGGKKNKGNAKLDANEALHIVLERTGRDYADLSDNRDFKFGDVEYYQFKFSSDDYLLIWYVNKQTGELYGGLQCGIEKYGGDADAEEIKQYVLDKLSFDPDDVICFDIRQSEILTFERKTAGTGPYYLITVHDKTPGKEMNTAFVQLNVFEEDMPLFRTDDELIDIVADDMGVDKSELESLEIEDEKSLDFTHVRFTVGDTDYWYVVARSNYINENIIKAKTQKSHGDKDFPIISEETAVKTAFASVVADSVDDVESCEVSFDDEKKQYTVTIIKYSNKVWKNVFWEFYIDGYTGLKKGWKYDDKDYYGPVTITPMTEQEAIEIAFKALERYGYQRSELTVSVEAERVTAEFELYCYHITLRDSVTVFTTDVYGDIPAHSNVYSYIDYEAVKATKIGKYISEEIAKEIAVQGTKDYYTINSCTLDESGEAAVYEIAYSTPYRTGIMHISAESGMVIDNKKLS